jgi:uncharacterized membrane protein
MKIRNIIAAILLLTTTILTSCSKSDTSGGSTTTPPCTGTIQYVNNSTNPYQISSNGAVLIASMAGKTSQYSFNLTPNTYTITVTQLSGYLVYPTIESFAPAVACNQTSVISFP